MFLDLYKIFPDLYKIFPDLYKMFLDLHKMFLDLHKMLPDLFKMFPDFYKIPFETVIWSTRYCPFLKVFNSYTFSWSKIAHMTFVENPKLKNFSFQIINIGIRYVILYLIITFHLFLQTEGFTQRGSFW